MKKLLFFTIMTVYTNFALAWNPPDNSLTFSNDTRTLTVATSTNSPTHILTRESGIQRNWIVNTSTFTIFVATSNTTVSFTNSFGIPGTPANATPVIWSPDGVNSPFAGDLWGAVNTNSSASISVFRSK